MIKLIVRILIAVILLINLSLVASDDSGINSTITGSTSRTGIVKVLMVHVTICNQKPMMNGVEPTLVVSR